MKISVIIPVYNAEKYVESTINSVLNQPYKDIEIICINDGSKDTSEQIIKEIMRKDSRVFYYAQENQGVGAARNRGMKLASGDWVAFLDSDDVWVSNVIDDSLVERIEEDAWDMVSFAYYNSNEKMTRVCLTPRNDEVIQNVKERINENYRHHSSYFFSRELLNSNLIEVDRFKRNEDVRFLFKCLYKAKRMLYISKPLFIYRNNDNSTTHMKISSFELYDDVLAGYKQLGENTCDMYVKNWSERTLVRLFVEYIMCASRDKNALENIKKVYQKYNIASYLNKGVFLSAERRKWLDSFLKYPRWFVFKRKLICRIYGIMRLAKKSKFIRSVYEKKRYPLNMVLYEKKRGEREKCDL